MKSKIVLLCIVLLLVPTVLAERGHITLLAVTEQQDNRFGSEADLYLEIEPGSGRVFIETFPLSRMDTQISTRFAKQIACSVLDVDCSGFDFIYTMRSNSVFIGGPSAGAALAVLTVAMLDGQEVRQDVGITGTINSGGAIGIVGNIKEKIEVAGDIGLKTVLIPAGTRFLTDRVTNDTTDLVEYGRELGVDVKVVSTLSEALFEFTEKRYDKRQKDVVVNELYSSTMKSLARSLCQRNDELLEEAQGLLDSNVLMQLENSTERSQASYDNELYYSAASFCFGSNVRLTRLIMQQQNLTQEEILDRIDDVREEIDAFDLAIDQRDIQTVTDLESYMAVKDRLIEGRESLDLAEEQINDTDRAIGSLAFGIERLNSASSWSTFFDHRDKQIILDENSLRNSCVDKLNEAEERFQYLRIAFPASQAIEDRREIENAYVDLNSGDYALCLFKASKAKAAVDAVISLIGVSSERFDSVLDEKLRIAQQNLIREEDNGAFPVLGYSYFEYARSLQESDGFSALLYSEYSLELSNVDIYFDSPANSAAIVGTVDVPFAGFFSGLVVGLIIALLLVVFKSKPKEVTTSVKKVRRKKAHQPRRKAKKRLQRKT